MSTPDDLEDLEAALQRAADEETVEKVDLLIETARALGSNAPRRILALSREAYALAERLGYARGRAYSLGYMGFAHYMLSEHDTAYGRLQEALALAQEADDLDGQALILSALAGVHLSLGNYEQAFARGIQALQLFRQTGNRFEEAWTMNGFGVAYADLGDYDRALTFFQEALAIFEDVGEQIGAARALNGIGTVYHSQGAYEQALPYHVQSLKRFEDAGNHIGEARALNDLGMVYHGLGEDEKAIDYHLRSLKIREAVENRQSQSTSLIQLGTIYLQRQEVDQALDALHRALAIARDVKARLRIYQAHQGLAEAYECAGDFVEALKHLKAYQQMREAVQGEEVQARFRNLQVRYEVEQAEKDAQIERLRNAELKEKNEEQARLLAELQTAQARLIQSEKMASLGQLTAGIAHEIKNPLNFVNNFAQLSMELADELADALAANREASVGQVLGDLDDVLRDLKFNAEKINEHGRRADRIVRSMLEHSRSAPGERRPIDLNALVEEYLGLAYHGARAQHSGFNVTLERTYDEAVGSVEVLPQEMGRVLLNLLNNAFYAVRARSLAADEAYAPTVSVQTQRKGEAVEIRVQDNGQGISEDIRSKIFEPFFTTKPTGEGTGLGLSLSYEIVTQGHGGTMTVESAEGKGAAFIVTLPA